MKSAIKLAVLILVAISLPSLVLAQRKPWTTQKCTIDGDIVSFGEVEVGTNTVAWVTIVDADGTPACLHLGGSLLTRNDGNAMMPPTCGDGNYFGQARLLADKKGARFDFDFGPLPCASPLFADVPPYWTDGDGLCPYRLVLVNGVYDGGTDTATFDVGTTVYLVDYTLGVPCGADPNNPYCINDYTVGDGPVSWRILFQLLPDSDGGDVPIEPEKGDVLCSDGKDNDGDGLIDCADPNCKKATPCS